jgi:hypothetical protein
MNEYTPSLERLARLARKQQRFLASLLEIYQTQMAVDDSQLASFLDCNMEALTHLALCQRPRPFPYFQHDIERIAQHIHLDPLRLTELIEAAELQEKTLQENEFAFQSAFGPSLENMLDLTTWNSGGTLPELYKCLEDEIKTATQQEERLRKDLFERVFNRHDAPLSKGCYQVTIDQLSHVHNTLLFNGAVEACNGSFETLRSDSGEHVQIRVSLVSYQGNKETWKQKNFRRDIYLRPDSDKPRVTDHHRGKNVNSQGHSSSDLSASRLLSLSERTILTEKSQALWRMGHGVPVPHVLLTDMGSAMHKKNEKMQKNDEYLLRQSISILRTLLRDHQRWVFVSTNPSDNILRHIGNMLHPLEYVIVDSPYQVMKEAVHKSLYGSDFQEDALQFVEETGKLIVTGVYRTSLSAPAYVFYAHEAFAHQAALLAMADSILQKNRGFPLLLDLADTLCRVTPWDEKTLLPLKQEELDDDTPYPLLLTGMI